MYRHMTAAVALLALAVGGCVSNQQDANDPIGWGRIDCRRSTDPEIAAHAEQARLMCQAMAESAGTMATATMPAGRGMGGAIASGIESGMARQQVTVAAGKDCMATQGYIMSRRSEFEARCTGKK